MDASISTAPKPSPFDLRDTASYLSLSKHSATAFVAFSHEDPSAQIQHARGFAFQEQTLDGGTLKFFSRNRIDTKTRDEDGKRIYREVAGTFLLSKLRTPKAYLFLTKEPAEFIHDGLQRLFYRSRKVLTRLHLCSGEMKDIVSRLVANTSGRLVVRRSIVRNKRQETTVSYETESLEELYCKAAADNAHVHSFDFRLNEKKTGKSLLNAGLNREGRFTFHDGDMELFFTAVIEHACEFFKKKDDLLQNRARSEATGYINPIRITFDEPVFDTKDGIRAFLRTLGHIRHGDFTIFHRNPYLHVAFFDFFDGSEFDLFVESSNVIVVVSQYEASSSSLFRLCQKVFEHFQEGVIAEDNSILRITGK